jgi:uncharacterized protein (TIGR02284 family)
MLLRNEAQMALNQVESLVVESADNYETAAGKTDQAPLSQLLTELAQERRQLASELAAHIRALDDLPQHPDPDREAVGNLFTSIKTFFSDNSSDVVIDERIRFENELAKAVQEAKQQALPQVTKNFLESVSSNIESARLRLEQIRH